MTTMRTENNPPTAPAGRAFASASMVMSPLAFSARRSTRPRPARWRFVQEVACRGPLRATTGVRRRSERGPCIVFATVGLFGPKGQPQRVRQSEATLNGCRNGGLAGRGERFKGI